VHRPNKPRRLPVVAQRLPDFSNHHIEIGLDDERIRPDGGQQVVLRQHVRPARQERTQQVERLGREPDIAAGPGQLPGV